MPNQSRETELDDIWHDEAIPWDCAEDFCLFAEMWEWHISHQPNSNIAMLTKHGIVEYIGNLFSECRISRGLWTLWAGYSGGFAMEKFEKWKKDRKENHECNRFDWINRRME